MRQDYDTYQDNTEKENEETVNPREARKAIQRLREANRGLQASIQAFHEVCSDLTAQAEANGGRIVSANEILEKVLAEKESRQAASCAPADLDRWDDPEDFQSTAKPVKPVNVNDIAEEILAKRERREKPNARQKKMLEPEDDAFGLPLDITTRPRGGFLDTLWTLVTKYNGKHH